MNFSDFVQAAKKLQEMPPPPVAVVLSRWGWQQVKLRTTDISELASDTPRRPKITDPLLYHFPDVPKEETVIFFDQEVLHQYLRLRKEIGHKAAIQRLSAEVDEELIVEAEVRALLNPS